MDKSFLLVSQIAVAKASLSNLEKPVREGLRFAMKDHAEALRAESYIIAQELTADIQQGSTLNEAIEHCLLDVMSHDYEVNEELSDQLEALASLSSREAAATIMHNYIWTGIVQKGVAGYIRVSKGYPLQISPEEAINE